MAAGHRRLPITTGGVDHIIGVAQLRDMAAAVTSTPSAPVATLSSPALRADPSLAIPHLLQLMQSSRVWIAIVVDDRGQTVGLATIEDLVAELVGEIADDDPGC